MLSTTPAALPPLAPSADPLVCPLWDPVAMAAGAPRRDDRCEAAPPREDWLPLCPPGPRTGVEGADGFPGLAGVPGLGLAVVVVVVVVVVGPLLAPVLMLLLLLPLPLPPELVVVVVIPYFAWRACTRPMWPRSTCVQGGEGESSSTTLAPSTAMQHHQK